MMTLMAMCALSMLAGYGVSQLDCVIGVTTIEEAKTIHKSKRIAVEDNDLYIFNVIFEGQKCDYAILRFKDGVLYEVSYNWITKNTNQVYTTKKKRLISTLGEPFDTYENEGYSVTTWFTEETLVNLEKCGKEFVMISFSKS